MSIKIMSALWDMQFSPVEKLVYLALADCANDEGLAWPSIATIARKTGVGERTVQRAIRAGEETGLIARQEIVGRGCKYTINPRHKVTPATKSPVTNETSTPATLAPHPRHAGTQTVIEPSRTIKSNIRAHEIPEKWTPSDFDAGSGSREILDGLTEKECSAMLEAFTAHHEARGNKFKDWQKAWSTWVLNSRRFENGNGRSNGHNQRGNGRPVDGFTAALRHVANGPPAKPFGDVGY